MPKNQTAVAAAPAGAANAIRIRGLWRDNDDKQNAVNKLIKALRESKSPYFNFMTKDAEGKEVPLKDENIIRLLQATAADDVDYAWPYDIVIPLSRPVSSR